MLEKRTLGQTNIEVSPIGIGVMLWLDGKGLIWGRFPAVAEVTKSSIIKEAINGGINFFDTAEIYGFGKSERALASALQANNISDADVVIGTKWRPIFRRARNMRKSIHKRIEFLSPYTIDLFMVHFPYMTFSRVKGQMKEMSALVRDKKIQSIGVSNFGEEKMRSAYALLENENIPLAVNQVEYSLLERTIEHNGVLDAAEELGVTIVAYSPIHQGLLTGKYHANPDLLKKKSRLFGMGFKKRLAKTQPLIDMLLEIGKTYKATPGQVALNWLITNRGNTVVAIPGATKVGHAQESAGGMTFQLSSSEREEIDLASHNVNK